MARVGKESSGFIFAGKSYGLKGRTLGLGLADVVCGGGCSMGRLWCGEAVVWGDFGVGSSSTGCRVPSVGYRAGPSVA